MQKTVTLISATILAAAALAACGGGGSNTNTSTTSPSASLAGNSGGSPNPKTAAAAHTAALKFSQCMRANGVPNFPDPGSGGGIGIQISASRTSGSGNTMTVNGVPVSAPAFQSAQTKCRKDLPKPPALSAAQIAQVKASAIAFAKCMRAHGVPNFPDPQITAGPGGHGIGIRMGVGASSGINRQSPAFQSASQKCGGKHGFGIRIGPGAGGA